MFTADQAATLLAYGFLVALVGIGYICGRLR